MSPNPITDQWTAGAGIRGRYKIRLAHLPVRFLVNLGQDRANSVIWLLLYIYSDQPLQNFKINHIQNSFIRNSKMTKTKKTLGRNRTCYHNYYGMNHVLEKACSKKLHWNQETIREYTVSHAPEVNYEKAMQYVDNPPPLPENVDDEWYKQHPKLPGSGKAPRKQLQPKILKKKGKAKGGVKKLPPAQ